MPVPHANVRRLAWKGLLRWAEGGVFAETLVQQAATQHDLDHADRAFLQALVYETLRNLSWLDHLRKRLRPAALEADIRWLVLIGLCQLFLLKQVEYAAVHETVSLAPRRVRAVVNAMLRSAVRRRGELEQERCSLPLSVRYSTPSWLVNRWVKQFGTPETEAMLEWNSRTPLLYARLNPLNPPATIFPDWCPVEGAPGWFRLKKLPLRELQAGQVYVADPSTRHCIRLLAPCAGERILDACAAPGGKSVAILGAAGGDVCLLATDSEKHRLAPLLDNLCHAGGRHVQVLCHDWTQSCPRKWEQSFDAVLLDVPCSNSGVVQRRVDVRWRLDEQEFSRLSVLQLRILEQAARAVRPGGRLVYSTCSIDEEEDRLLVEQFLAGHPEFWLKEDYLALPHREQADGAYAALLVRT